MMRSLLFLVLLSLSCTCLDAVYFDVNNCNTIACVFVSPNGDDLINNGTSSFPFRNIHFALKSAKTATVPTTIVLADGSYPAALPPTYPSGIVWTGSNVTLTSINGPSSTIIDCFHIPNVRGLWIGSGETSSTIISGITIQNCRTTMGAGMAIVGANTKPTIRDVQLINNQATNGGGGLFFFSSPTLINVTISGGTANNGAGLFITHNATLMNPAQLQAMSLALNYFAPNPLPRGETAYVKMSYMTFTGNSAVSPGGAYFLMSAYRVTCDSCVYSGNSGAGSGAIAAGAASNFVVTNSIFQQNKALSAHGGAISIQQGSTGIINSCSFIGNIANQNGGAVAVGLVGLLASRVNITNSIFDGNQANQGSILYNDVNAHAIITGCTTRNNVALIQGGIYLLNNESAARYNIASNTYENNVAQGNYGADYGSYANNLVFIEPNNSTQIGFSGSTPSIYPVNTSTSLSRTVLNLDSIHLKILLLDTFGQRLDLNESNQTGVLPGIYSDITTLDNMTVPALLVQSTRVKMPTGVSDVQVILVGELTKTYAVTFSSDLPNVQPIRLLVTIKPCSPYDYTTFYDSTTFPICHPAQAHHLSDSLFNAILVLSCILMACVVIVQGLTIWYWNTPVFKGSTPIFMSLMLLGAIIGYLATILSVLDVNRTTMFDVICKSQYWMMGVAFILMFATLALKTWRIRNIFCNETLTEIRSVTTWGLLRWLLVVLAIEMLIHILWISIDPLHSTLQVFTGGQLSTTCGSKYDNVFLIVNLVYKGLIALVCVIFAYQTRDVASRFNESRQLMIASYNMFVCVIVIAALSLALPDPDARRTVYAVGALFVITSTWFVLFTPKLYLAIFKKDRNTSTGPAAPTGSGGKYSHSTGKTSHSDHHKSTDKYMTKSSLNNNMTTGNVAACATPHSHTRSKAGSIASTAPGSPAVGPHRLALNLNQRSSMSNVMGPSAVGSPVGGSPHVHAVAMTIPRQLSTLTLSRAPQIHEDDGISSDHVVIETEAMPADVTPFHQSRRTSQPALFADAGYSMLEMNTLTNNTNNNTNNHSPNTNTTRSIPPAKNFI